MKSKFNKEVGVEDLCVVAYHFYFFINFVVVGGMD